MNDRGREGRLPGSPSLRTVRPDFPGTALQLVVLPRRGLTGYHMGCFQGVQPKLRKVGIRPTLMIRTATTPTFLLTLAQDAPQTHAYPFVDGLERGVVAMPEVTKPSLHRAVTAGGCGGAVHLIAP